MRITIAPILAAALFVGCASPDSTTVSESPSVREYPTGSSIPRKDRNPQAEGIRVHTREDLERIQNSGSGNTPGVSR